MKWHFWADYTTFLDCLITYSTIVTVLCLQGGRSATIILAQGQYCYHWLTIGESHSPQCREEASPEQLCHQSIIYKQ